MDQAQLKNKIVFKYRYSTIEVPKKTRYCYGTYITSTSSGQVPGTGTSSKKVVPVLQRWPLWMQTPREKYHFFSRVRRAWKNKKYSKGNEPLLTKEKKTKEVRASLNQPGGKIY